jgi:hypothetical protein
MDTVRADPREVDACAAMDVAGRAVLACFDVGAEHIC